MSGGRRWIFYLLSLIGLAVGLWGASRLHDLSDVPPDFARTGGFPVRVEGVVAGSPAEARILAVLDRMVANDAQARKHFQEAGVDALVEVVVGDAHETVKQLRGPVDLLFLDADKEGYASYLQTLLPLVRPGGLIAADNIAMAPEYAKAVTTDPRLDTVFFGRFAVTMKKR